MNYFLCDKPAFEHDILLVNGDRAHGRLEMNDVEAALDRFGYEEVVIVGGTPAGSDPNEVVTVAVFIQRQGNAVGEVTAMTVDELQRSMGLQMQHIDYFCPGLVTQLNEFLFTSAGHEDL